MNLIYIDDSGNTGKKLDDSLQPLFLLGGFIVDETIWRDVDNSINTIKAAYGLSDVEVHAIDVMNGKNGTPYKSWDYSKKLAFLKEILSLIEQYDLHVIYFSVKKSNFKAYFESKYGKGFEQQFTISPYLLAFSYILQISDAYLVSKESNGILILDEQDEWKKPATKTFNLLRTITEEPEVKIEKLIDRSFFIDSAESNMIQLADIIAYTTKRYLEIEIKEMEPHKKAEREELYAIYQRKVFKPKFEYAKHPILTWLENNIGNQ
jgi:hypothetical protein